MDELVIKVPAPFSGIEDLGFSARYPAQERSEPLRDIPLFVEGPAGPMHLLVERLALFSDKDRIVGSHRRRRPVRVDRAGAADRRGLRAGVPGPEHARR